MIIPGSIDSLTQEYSVEVQLVHFPSLHNPTHSHMDIGDLDDG